MSNTAEGGSNGIVSSGPSNVYEGANACSSMDGNTPGDMTPPIRTSPAPQKAGKHLFGNFSD